MSGQYGITKLDDFDFLANFVGELLKGYRTSNDKAITRIPQSKVNVGLQLINEEWDTNLRYYHYFDKEFTGPFYTRTGGHSRLDFDLTKDFMYSDLSGHAMFSVCLLYTSDAADDP